MAIIKLNDRAISDPGYEQNTAPTAFSFVREISPVMNGITLAADDVLVLKTFSYNQVVDIYLKHFGPQGTDATLAVNATYGVFDPNTSGIQKDINGEPILITPSYFVTGLTFATARNEEFSLQRQQASREALSIGQGINDTLATAAINTGQQACLVFVVTAPPTGTIRLAFKGTTRGY